MWQQRTWQRHSQSCQVISGLEKFLMTIRHVITEMHTQMSKRQSCTFQAPPRAQGRGRTAVPHNFNPLNISHSCAGAAALCIDDVAALSASVAAAPRAAAHASLTFPQAALGDLAGPSSVGGGGGVHRSHPDAAIAYQLMQGVSSFLY